MKICRRSGITVFELLITLAVIAILLGLMLPLIMRMRLIAARMESHNKLKQIGLALHSHHDARRTLPPGVDNKNISGLAHILPYIEQQNLYNQMDFNKDVTAQANQFIRSVRVPTYTSPLDTLDRDSKFGPTNYFLCAGTKHSHENNNGMFYSGSRLNLANIPDGTSNTVMVGESLRGDGSKKAVTVRRQHVDLAKGMLTKLKAESGVAEFKMGKNIASNRGASWMDGRFLQSTFNATRKLNDTRPDVNCAGLGGLSGLRSDSLRTINVGIGDGSVRAVADTVSLQTWKNACNTADGNVLGNDW